MKTTGTGIWNSLLGKNVPDLFCGDLSEDNLFEGLPLNYEQKTVSKNDPQMCVSIMKNISLHTRLCILCTSRYDVKRTIAEPTHTHSNQQMSLKLKMMCMNSRR